MKLLSVLVTEICTVDGMPILKSENVQRFQTIYCSESTGDKHSIYGTCYYSTTITLFIETAKL
jgi:hypothetical protein